MEPFHQTVKMGWINIKCMEKNRPAPLFDIIIGCHDTAQSAGAFPDDIYNCLNHSRPVIEPEGKNLAVF